MTDLRLAPYAAATLRLALGVMFLAHSVGLKLLTFGLPGTAHFFVSVGLPAWLGYLTFAAEAAGGVLLVLGVQSRWVALSLVLPLVGDRKSTRLNSSHRCISYDVFCLIIHLS